MTEEIKEILDYLKRSDKNKFGFEQGKLIDYEETQLLLDYITNLQQLYENALKVNQNANKYRTELESKYVLLQLENEKLKEQNNDLRKIYRNTYKRLFENGNDVLAHYFQAQIDDCPTFYVKPIIDYAKEYKIYKSRCEKAVEYIKEHIKYECDDNFNGMSFYSYHLYDFKKEDLLNILNGSDEK